ncbi:hypothetical protein ACFQ7F_17560 [Streptomyces sp. NPDC056486]|uniref:hypothetical protein n=1 Tax=Streptomyces sp. NPDC056486 TaxID=3345835 RepID=UPI0036CCAB9D
MYGATTEAAQTADERQEARADRRQPSPEQPDRSLTWRTLGLDAMASMLVVSLRRLGRTGFTAQCQWPRFHPLNERAIAVAHHPLIMVESTRQIAVALERGHLSAEGLAPLEPVAVSLGLQPRVWPTERGSATDVAVRVSVSDHATQAGELAFYRITAEYRHAGTPFGSCTMRMVRPAHLGAPCALAVPPPALLHPPAAALGAAADTDVMLARAPQGRLAIVPRDPRHPVLTAGRTARLPAPAVLEAARQAALLTSGMTAAAVAGLRVELRAPVPPRGALVEVTPESEGFRVLVTVSDQVVALGTVALLRP